MVRYIPKQSIVGFAQKTINRYTFKLPVSVDTICPHCKRKINYHIEWITQLNTSLNYTITHCPACQGQVRFIQIIEKSSPDETLLSGEIFIYPGAELRQPVKGSEEFLADGIDRTYLSTINAFNAQEWTATSVLCGRALEGVIKSILPPEETTKSLANQLGELPEHLELHKPILTLADAIRKGGHLETYFDLEKEPNEEISALMVDLLDYLIEYLFILPKRIEALHDKIENLSKPVPSPDSD